MDRGVRSLVTDVEVRAPLVDPAVLEIGDHGGEYRAIRYTERLAEAEAVASVGSVGDAFDCEHNRRAA